MSTSEYYHKFCYIQEKVQKYNSEEDRTNDMNKTEKDCKNFKKHHFYLQSKRKKYEIFIRY